jgi:hypothetical protein
MIGSRWAVWCWIVSAGCVVALPAVSACQAADPSTPLPPVDRPPALASGARVLMIGNSLTDANLLVEMVEALADSAGLSWEVEPLVGGGSLEDHWNRGTVQPALTRTSYDIVVLQQGPSTLEASRTHLRHWSAVFDEAIRATGARTALYMVWPEANRATFFDRVRDSYALAAADVGGRFLPAGETWRAAWRRDPATALYGPDAFHPSAVGSYTAALAIVAGLTDRSPVGFALTLTRPNGDTLVSVPPLLGAMLQAAAAEAATTYRDYRPSDVP